MNDAPLQPTPPGTESADDSIPASLARDLVAARNNGPDLTKLRKEQKLAAELIASGRQKLSEQTSQLEAAEPGTERQPQAELDKTREGQELIAEVKADVDAAMNRRRIRLVGHALYWSLLIVSIVWLWLRWDSARGQVGASVAIGLLVALGLLAVALKPFSRFLMGEDNRLSTSRLQPALWTAALIYAFAFLLIQGVVDSDLVCNDDSGTEPTGISCAVDNIEEGLTPEYLLLLGGPFAAAIAAGYSVGQRVADGSLQKTSAEGPSLKNLVTNDSEQADLVDLQFLAFNLLALGYFAVMLDQDSSRLPDLPDTLVGLTSLGALTYVGAKVAKANAPVITAITLKPDRRGPVDEIRPGSIVQIHGTNFMPPGADNDKFESQVKAKVASNTISIPVAYDGSTRLNPQNDKLEVQVPEATSPGAVPVQVITAAGVESDQRHITVVEDRAVLTGSHPPRLTRPASAPQTVSLTIRGRYFHKAGAPLTEEPSVTVQIDQGQAAAGQVTDHDRHKVTISVAVGTGAQQARITVQANGTPQPSEPLIVPIIGAAN